MDYLERYLAFMRSQLGDLTGLKFGLDASNGMASLLVRKLFPQATIINDEMDGSFPAHSPNPLDPAARRQMSELVRLEGLDLGVIFDGDADRCMVVDEKGDFVQPDYLIPLVVPVKGEKVIHDVRTSRGVIEYIREQGGEPVMVPVGHAFAKPILRKIGSIGGGELAGHYYFRDFHGCDSGLLAAIRILGEAAKAKRAGMVFSQLMAPIATRYANSGELNYRVEDKDGAMERIREWFGGEVNDLDGYRMEKPEGWMSVRKSNTEPYLRLLVEAQSEALMREWIRGAEKIIHES